jgi:hypothetical protein
MAFLPGSSWMSERGRDVSDLIGQMDFIDFKALGYKGDPIIYGGRFKQLPWGRRPQSQHPKQQCRQFWKE